MIRERPARAWKRLILPDNKTLFRKLHEDGQPERDIQDETAEMRPEMSSTHYPIRKTVCIKMEIGSAETSSNKSFFNFHEPYHRLVIRQLQCMTTARTE